MPKIVRATQKIFAADAVNNGQFGSAQLGTKLLTSDPAQIQALDAWDLGWLEAVIGTKKFPPLEEFQAIDYLNTRQLAYLFQQGIAEWDAGTTYYMNSIVCKPGTYELYGSRIDDNLNNALPNAVTNTNWQFLIDLSVNAKIPYGKTSGPANAYVVATAPVFTSMADGFIFEAQINASNTGAFTVNPNAIGVKNVFVNNAAAVGGEVRLGVNYLFSYDQTNDRLILLGASPVNATQTYRGIAQIATNAEALAGVVSDKILTPAGLVAAFGSKQQGAYPPGDGYQVFPGGLILQWGRCSIFNPSTIGEWTYPIAFPNACMANFATQDYLHGPGVVVQISPDTTNATTLRTKAQIRTSTTGGDSFSAFAIGY